MTPEQAAALRAPFPASQIGQLPRGGIMLDYVGHAATTDRLLQVDPEWTWEPAAVGPNGEPLVVDGGLWIKLTVAGVTRYGYGDGPTVKEMIGDAIRNAAMRFGVALDLWARDGLAGGAVEDVAAAVDKAIPKPTMVSNEQHGKIGAIIGDLVETGQGGTTKESWEKLSRDWIYQKYGKRSRRELSAAEASALIDWLVGQLKDLEASF